jgi:inorganic phosphate transporter, PiT family
MMVHMIGLCVTLWMAWNIGANDLANVISPSLGASVLRYRYLIGIVAIFECLGAWFGASAVSHTIGQHLVQINHLLPKHCVMILCAAALWMQCASHIGLPVSITHTIVGASIGVSSTMTHHTAMHWSTIVSLGLTWVSAPLLSGALGYLWCTSIQKRIFAAVDVMRAFQMYSPWYAAMTCFIILMGPLRVIGLHYASWSILTILAISVSCLTYGIGRWFMRSIPTENSMAKFFKHMAVVATAAMVFAHGANDVGIAIGPMLAMNGIMVHLENALIMLTLISILIGLFVQGRRVIATVGHSITLLTPMAAFTALLSASSTVLCMHMFAMPISTTQTLVGAVLGVGMTRGIGAVNYRVVRNILCSWMFTLPLAAALGRFLTYWV